MLRHAICCLLLLLLLPGMVFAGEGGTIFGGHGGINVGGLFWDVTEVNDFLKDGSIDELPSVLPTIGGGGQAILFGGVVIGGRGSVAQYHLGGDSLAVDAAISYGFMDLGYAVINRERWLLTPVASIGGATFQLEMDGELSALDIAKYSSNYDPRNPDASLEDKLLMTSSTLIGHVGISAYHQIRFTESESGAFGAFLVGMSTGWIFELTHNGWEIDGDDVKNGPSYSPHGFYLQLELHFGGGTTGNEYQDKKEGRLLRRYGRL